MKKYFITFVSAIMAVTSVFAQSTFVATLSHGNDISIFYGSYALKDALEAADNGDIINLSGGAFQAVDITKAVTIRGTGIDNANSTHIVNDFNINIPSTVENRFTMEGVRCDGTMYLRGQYSNPYFMRCRFATVYVGYSSDDNVKNALFANCKITGIMYSCGASTSQAVNSFFIGTATSSSSCASYINCIIWDSNLSDDERSELYNSILVNTDSWHYALPSSSVATNCVAIGYDNPNYRKPFDDLVSSTGCTTSTYEEMFKSFNGEYSDEQTFELTDAAKAKFLGADGTQVGLYGGVLPYTSTPSYPQITKLNADNKTTTDGKLNVVIEVGAAQ